MRVIFLFAKYAVGLSIALVLLGLVSREALLFWGVQKLKWDVDKAELISRSRGEYEDQCRQKAGGASGKGIKYVQVRFTSDTQYQTEVVCELFSNDPIVVSEYSLPFQVKKAQGESGFIWQEDTQSGVALDAFGRQTSLVLNGKSIDLKQGHFSFEGIQPESTCRGFGYACCSPETQVGEGELLSEVSDCSMDCYARCVSRPTVLRFTSDPNPSLDTRTLTIGKGEVVTFYFVTDPGQAGQADTTIQFGDGQSQTVAEKETNLSHTYNCAQAQCQYQATLNMLDPNGQTNLPTAVSAITVNVR